VLIVRRNRRCLVGQKDEGATSTGTLEEHKRDRRNEKATKPAGGGRRVLKSPGPGEGIGGDPERFLKQEGGDQIGDAAHRSSNEAEVSS